MGQALYRKYRSKTLDDVVGQEHVTTTLKHALRDKTISHAYLFTGPKGVGKTSVARILAHEINNLDYVEPVSHLDIIEIDAASNRRIDEIRELRDKVHTSPSSAQYKVYIIDEVHMLTREAFNALLKTLEEPPEHAVFILATTEAHKLPETIISRTQHFSFKPVKTDSVKKHILSIAKLENIELEEPAAELIAKYGQGSFRDSISLLDSLRTGRSHISENDVRDAIGLAPEEVISNIINLMNNGNSRSLTLELDKASSTGYQSIQLANQISQTLREKVIETGITNRDIQLLQELLTVASAPNPDASLELILLQNQLLNSDPGSNTSTNESGTNIVRPNESEVTSSLETTLQKDKAVGIEVVKTDSDSPKDLWEQVLSRLKQHNNALYGIARMAKTDISHNILSLSLSFPFHLKRLSDSKNDAALRKIVKDIDPSIKEIKYRLVADKPDLKPVDIQKPDLKSINDIFGGAEVLES